MISLSSCNYSTKNDKVEVGENSINNIPKESTAKPINNYTQSGDPTFVLTHDINSPQGPHSITRNILQDRNGIIWLATWEGIISYDGKQFTNITLKEGLEHWHVFSILEDKSGNLWFGTIGGGVYRYDGNSFSLFTTSNKLAGNVVLSMWDDKVGNVWFATTNGISRCSYEGKIFSSFTTQNGLINNFTNTILQDKTGKFWFGTRGGISCYYKNEFTNFSLSNDLSFHNVTSIVEDRAGNIWIGSQEGLHCYDGRVLTDSTKNFPGKIIFEDRRGNLYINGSKPGGRGMTMSKYDGNSIRQIASNTNQVFGITEDRDGNIWFGTEAGVSRYNGQGVVSY